MKKQEAFTEFIDKNNSQYRKYYSPNKLLLYNGC
jgi:hypothetical protein